jgi:hypothetical protein
VSNVLTNCLAALRARHLAAAALLLVSASPASAADAPQFTLTLRNHVFVPAQLVVPANTKFKLVVVNEDATPEEFESHELNREKIVTGKGRITVFLGPLKPGKYPFFGEFHMATAQGSLIAR